MPHSFFHAVLVALLLTAATACAQPSPEAAPPSYDPALAQALGADDRGMHAYVLVVLKTGPNKVPTRPERDAMFKGHFANMSRLSAEGKLALAGPFDGTDGWRGPFILSVADIEEARKLVATDPVIINGEMVAEHHVHYGSAALMLVKGGHERVTKKRV